MFDADYYLEKYPDLQKVFGNDEEALYNHYVNYGLKEGRNASDAFDVNAYREMYADLDAAYGDNWQGYVEHYLTFGINEERDGGGEFDAVSYAKRYPDVYAAYGLDLSKLKEHYEVYGKTENRQSLSQAVVEEQEAIAAAAAAAAEEAADEPEVEETVQINKKKFELAAMHLHNLASYYRSYNEILESTELTDSEKLEQSAEYVELYNETYLLYAAARDEAVKNMTKEESIYWHDMFTKLTEGSGLSATNLPEELAFG